MEGLIYRLQQKARYHLSGDPLKKRIAEINRFREEVTFNNHTFGIDGLEIPRKFSFLLERYDVFKSLLSLPGTSFEADGEQVIFEIDGIKLAVTTAEELFIIQEVFLTKSYEIVVTAPYVVIDIGMNVGYASLFFAKNPQVKKVIGFEPFKPTFEQATKNFKLNPSCRDKIYPHNLGLGKKNETMEARFSEDLKGKNSLFRSNKGDLHLIDIKKASVVLNEIFLTGPLDDFFIKMDCEGAEFDIFKDFIENGLNRQVMGFIIEWHFRYPQVIIDFLVKEGFKIHVNDHSGIGLIIAFR